MPGPEGSRIKVWDGGVRLFHWALVALVAGSWWSGEERDFEWHRPAGYAILALLLFRIVWGFVGSTTARFSDFLRGPGAIAAHIRGRLPAKAGHNPLGGWSVAAMLVLLLAQVGLGLFAVDVDGLDSGPFSYLVDFDTGRWAAEMHHLVFNLLLAVIALHILAIAYYRVVKRENLVKPMVSGTRDWPGQRPALTFASPVLALVLAILAGGAVWGAIHFFGRV